ncbi:MAG: hypothetical protein E7290_01240 [Lachnospiraceae bacterium]|nr:hypothetical protein [Lachnospiraceae bacterium]
MRIRILALMCVIVLVMTACGKESQEGTGCRCCSNGCSCCRCAEQTIVIEDANKVLGLTTEETKPIEGMTPATVTDESESTEVMSEVQESTSEEEPEVATTVEQIQEPVEVKDLTEGEKEARRQFVQQLAQQRETLYALPNSVDKMNQIAQIDTMIIQNNPYDFSEKHISFIGDSITESVGGKIDENGKRISYVDYVQDYLNIGEVLNRGSAGRMYTVYGGEDYSFVKKLDSTLYALSDATVIFLGVNDYLSEQQDKRYGEQNVDSYSDAGYCGALRATMKYLKNNFADRDIFFVLVYNVDRNVNATYTDATPAPTLKEFMDIQKAYAEHYGFHVIDIYSTGIMDLSDAAIEATYTADGLHPNDSGNVALAQHIAAELVLYYSQK